MLPFKLGSLSKPLWIESILPNAITDVRILANAAIFPLAAGNAAT